MIIWTFGTYKLYLKQQVLVALAIVYTLKYVPNIMYHIKKLCIQLLQAKMKVGPV